jgi:predicted permease
MLYSCSPLSSIAAAYVAIVAVAFAWAVVVDMRLADSAQEHLLPGAVLMLITMPTSLVMGPLYEHWPSVFGNGFVQLGGALLCGLLQAGVVLGVGNALRPRGHAA